MTDQTKKEQQQSSGVDVFNMTSASQRTESGKEVQPDAINAPPSTRSRSLPALQAWHLIVLALVAGAIWVAWPFISGASRAEPSHASSSRMLNPNQGGTAAAPNLMVPSKNVEPSGGVKGAKPGSDAVVTGEESKPASPLDAVNAKTGADAERRIDELQSKLTAAEAKLTTCSIPTDVAEIKKQPSYEGARRYPARRSNSSMQHQLPSPAVSGFSLNTIYRGQAWIQTNERTYVVQPGDLIEGILIERIEPIKRRVITSRGVIR